MESVKIEKIATGDVSQLQQIGKQTFSETFSSDNSAENMQQYLQDQFSYEKLAEELSNENSGFYFAKINGAPVGYLKVNFGDSQTELKDSKALEIERIYVLKEYHGKKVGQLLYQKAIDIATEKNMQYVWLGVWEQNHRAINFYRKNGFEAFGNHIFKLGDDAQTDIMMKLKLQ